MCQLGTVWIHFLLGFTIFPLSRLRNGDGWSGFWGRLFQTKSVMGRLWDDHFRDLGYPPKLYRVQDAGFIGGSSILWQILVIIMKNRWETSKHTMCFFKSDITNKNRKRQGCWPQKSGVGMHQNHNFQAKPMKNQKHQEINPRTTIEISPIEMKPLTLPPPLPGSPEWV